MNASGTKPRRIAFCITELDPGGAERCLVELTTRLDRQQYEPLVYCLGPRPQDNPTSLADLLEQAGVTVRYFGARHAVQLPWIARAVVRQMRADRPRIVQGFLFHANAVGAWAARQAGVPHVLTGIRVAERRHDWHLRVARWADKWVERHVCVSQMVSEFSRLAGGLPAHKLVVIPNGVDATRFSVDGRVRPSDLGIAADRRLITFIGRLDEQKNLAWLLELTPGVLEAQGAHDLLLVGVGPQRARLQQQAARLGIARRVHFTGFRSDVPEILAASDVLVLPSRWEGMPNVVLEAMAAGKPVVATDVEGVSEALGPGAAQQAVRVGHAEAFAAKLRLILGDAPLAAALGRENRERVRQHFSIDAMVTAYERLYASLD
ncbi:MAG: glycosyltransferase [Pirellulales bacterium]